MLYNGISFERSLDQVFKKLSVAIRYPQFAKVGTFRVSYKRLWYELNQ